MLPLALVAGGVDDDIVGNYHMLVGDGGGLKEGSCNINHSADYLRCSWAYYLPAWLRRLFIFLRASHRAFINSDS